MLNNLCSTLLTAKTLSTSFACAGHSGGVCWNVVWVGIARMSEGLKIRTEMVWDVAALVEKGCAAAVVVLMPFTGGAGKGKDNVDRVSRVDVGMDPALFLHEGQEREQESRRGRIQTGQMRSGKSHAAAEHLDWHTAMAHLCKQAVACIEPAHATQPSCSRVMPRPRMGVGVRLHQLVHIACVPTAPWSELAVEMRGAILLVLGTSPLSRDHCMLVHQQEHLGPSMDQSVGSERSKDGRRTLMPGALGRQKVP
ncbi:hypothetical protein B0H10DRAFT_1953694 [Mycena sp. CBHHK59/15]|nr:hypothetical protein B0H10DRAFT_1953694 [Mycena sp. CBHHK59/15]